ncbi:MAG: Hsp70 family protein, partial [Oscillospiraceae bacterium]|nr:Hsp70 family protein [Oscillospiraceae bacterium]
LQGERQFARDNKQLGTFRLDGIAPAMRGVPRIEVTFDIDRNGIVHVTAKDQGTGKEQNISITASTNMSKEDIEKAVKEAEQYAAEDKKRRDEVDTKNDAENLVLQCERALKDFGDKVSDGDKADVESKIAAVKTATESGTVDQIKAKMEDLQKAFYGLTEKVYGQNGGQGGMPGGMGGAAGMGGMAQDMTEEEPNNGDDDVIDTDFTEE